MQCLHTSEDISQRKSSSSRWKLGSWPLAGTRCSTNATCRQVLPLSPPVLSCELPVQFRPSSGTSFHSLQATSHALQPMQIEVSVKNPIRGGCSVCPAAAAGSLPPSRTSSSGRVARIARIGHFSIPVSVGDAGAPLVGLDQREALRSAGPAPGLDVDGQRLDLLDVRARIQRHRGQLVHRVAARVAVRAPVVGHPDRVHDAPVELQRRHPVGHEHPRLDHAAGGHERRPAAVLEPALGRQLGRDLAEELGLQLGQVRRPAAHAAGGEVLGQPVGRDRVREHVGAGSVRVRVVAVVLVDVGLLGPDFADGRAAGCEPASPAARSASAAARRRPPAARTTIRDRRPA